MYDPSCKEIAVNVNVNDSKAVAIIDTGSPVTVISKGMFERMGVEFEENKIKKKSNLKNSVKLLNYFLAKSTRHWKR